MIITTDAKQILFYGDSLVYGKVPAENRRWPIDVRFTGVAQNALGLKYDIIEEGLRGRTLVGENGYFAERNGLEQFGPVIGSHLPVDLLIIVLGTNDANNKNTIAPQDTAKAFLTYKEKLDDWVEFLGTSTPKVLVVGPPDIDADKYDNTMSEVFGEGAPHKVREIRAEIEKIAKLLHYDYFDSSSCYTAGADGIHPDEQNTRRLGEELAAKIKTII